MRYAMILSNRVADIIETEIEPKYPPDSQGNEVIAILCEDMTIEVGMIFENGAYKKWSIEDFNNTPKYPTQLDRIEEAILKENEAIATEAIDSYTLELMEEGLL